jgi:hypothetical protein
MPDMPILTITGWELASGTGVTGPGIGTELHDQVTLNEVKGTISSMAPFAALRVTNIT